MLQLTLLKANGLVLTRLLSFLNFVKLSSLLQFREDQNFSLVRYYESRLDVGMSRRSRLRLDSIRSAKMWRLVLLAGTVPPIVTVDKVTGV